MSKTATRSDPKLWEQVKDEITAAGKGGDPGQWSARKAQMAVQEYKKRGGGYEGDKNADNSLKQWTDEQNAEGDDHSDECEPNKANLYKEAQQRDVPGRSSMNKAELKDALGESRGRSGKTIPRRTCAWSFAAASTSPPAS